MVSFRGFRMCSLREYAKCIEISAKTPEFLPVYMGLKPHECKSNKYTSRKD